MRSGGLPGGLGSAPGSTAWKIGSFGGHADDDAIALDDSNDREEPFRSRAGPYAGGESPATALAAPPDPIYPLRSSRREQVADRRPARHRRTVCDDGVAGAQRLFAPRHATVSKTVRERSDRRRRRFATDAPATWLSTRCSRSGGSISRRRHRQYARGRAVFPRRRTGAKSQPTPSSLRQGAPVNPATDMLKTL